MTKGKTGNDLLVYLLELTDEERALPIAVLDYDGMEMLTGLTEVKVVPAYEPQHPGEGEGYPASIMLTVNVV